MKRAFYTLFLFFPFSAFAQYDTTHRRHLEGIPMVVVVIINGIIVTDTAISYNFLEKCSDKIKSKKAYTVKEGLKKLRIPSVDGILVCTLKKGFEYDEKTGLAIRKE